MRINLRVEYISGESKEVVCSAADLVKFESEYNLSVTRLEAEMKLTHLLFLAYSSLSRQKLTTSSFDDWIQTVSTILPSETDPK